MQRMRMKGKVWSVCLLLCGALCGFVANGFQVFDDETKDGIMGSPTKTHFLLFVDQQSQVQMKKVIDHIEGALWLCTVFSAFCHDCGRYLP